MLDVSHSEDSQSHIFCRRRLLHLVFTPKLHPMPARNALSEVKLSFLNCVVVVVVNPHPRANELIVVGRVCCAKGGAGVSVHLFCLG